MANNIRCFNCGSNVSSVKDNCVECDKCGHVVDLPPRTCKSMSNEDLILELLTSQWEMDIADEITDCELEILVGRRDMLWREILSRLNK